MQHRSCLFRPFSMPRATQKKAKTHPLYQKAQTLKIDDSYTLFIDFTNPNDFQKRPNLNIKSHKIDICLQGARWMMCCIKFLSFVAKQINFACLLGPRMGGADRTKIVFFVSWGPRWPPGYNQEGIYTFLFDFLVARGIRHGAKWGS